MTDVVDDETRLRRQAEARADAKLGFRSHLIAYLLVNAGLFALDFLTGREDWWFHWTLIGWGIGLAVHFASVYWAPGPSREAMVERELERLKRGR